MAGPALRIRTLVPCDPGPPLDWRDALDAGHVVVLGDMHGTAEIPRFALAAACAAATGGHRVALAIEWPASLEDAPPAALLASDFLRDPFQDGRRSRAMLDLVQTARRWQADGLPIDLVFLDPADDSRDAGMAARARAWIDAHPDGVEIVLVGNIHARLVRGWRDKPEYRPMGERLLDLGPRLASLNVRYGDGDGWNCQAGGCGIHPLHGPGERLAIGWAATREAYDGWYDVGPPSASPPAVVGRPWPEADALFRSDPRWLGGDGASSVDLGGDRVLWLFGDSFVAEGDTRDRAHARLVRNSVAVQTGTDPAHATLTFAWGTGPSSFFPERRGRWYWPQAGIQVGGSLVVFLARVRPTGEGLGFEADGGEAVLIDHPGAAPTDWRVRRVASPRTPAGFVVGGAVVRQGDHVVALARRDPGDHAAALVRWPADDVALGRLTRAEWWDGDGWTANGTPAIVLADAGSECSIHVAPDGRYVLIRSEGFGASTVVASTAPRLEGPWSAPTPVFRPPESGRPDAFVYAGKAHPELPADGDVVITYAANTSAGFETLVNDTTLYWPRLVRVPAMGLQ